MNALPIQKRGFALAGTAVAVPALATGCGGSKGSSSAAAADPSGCAKTATKNAEGGFCLVLPAQFKSYPDPSKQQGHRYYQYADGNGNGVSIDVSSLGDIDTWDFEVKGYQSNASDPDRSQSQAGDTSGGGKFWQYVEDNRTQIDVLNHKGNTLFYCKVFGDKPAQSTLDACKSLHPL